jgi:hypothetical protein
MMLKITSAWLGIALLASLSLRAQTPAPAQPQAAPLEPFQGVIQYRITYPDIKDPSLLAMLPDSQSITFAGPWLLSQSFGGQATQLGQWTLWNADSGTYWLVSDSERIVYTLPADKQVTNIKLTKNASAKKRTILAHPCLQYDFFHDQLTDSWWMNDSLFIAKPAVDSLVKMDPPFFAGGKRSIPLRMVRKSAAGTTVVEAVKITSGNSVVRALPEDYKRVEFNPLLPRHPLTGLKEEEKR